MEKIKKTLKKIDIAGVPPTHTVEGQEIQFKSVKGGLLSILIISLSMSYTFYTLFLWQDGKIIPKTVISQLQVNYQDTINFVFQTPTSDPLDPFQQDQLILIPIVSISMKMQYLEFLLQLEKLLFFLFNQVIFKTKQMSVHHGFLFQDEIKKRFLNSVEIQEQTISFQQSLFLFGQISYASFLVSLDSVIEYEQVSYVILGEVGAQIGAIINIIMLIQLLIVYNNNKEYQSKLIDVIISSSQETQDTNLKKDQNIPTSAEKQTALAQTNIFNIHIELTELRILLDQLKVKKEYDYEQFMSPICDESHLKFVQNQQIGQFRNLHYKDKDATDAWQKFQNALQSKRKNLIKKPDKIELLTRREINYIARQLDTLMQSIIKKIKPQDQDTNSNIEFFLNFHACFQFSRSLFSQSFNEFNFNSKIKLSNRKNLFTLKNQATKELLELIVHLYSQYQLQSYLSCKTMKIGIHDQKHDLHNYRHTISRDYFIYIIIQNLLLKSTRLNQDNLNLLEYMYKYNKCKYMTFFCKIIIYFKIYIVLYLFFLLKLGKPLFNLLLIKETLYKNMINIIHFINMSEEQPSVMKEQQNSSEKDNSSTNTLNQIKSEFFCIDEGQDQIGKVFNQFVQNLQLKQNKFIIHVIFSQITLNQTEFENKQNDTNQQQQVAQKIKFNLQSLQLIHIAHHTFGQWSLIDQSEIDKKLQSLREYFTIYISEDNTLQFFLRISGDMMTVTVTNELAQQCSDIQPQSLEITLMDTETLSPQFFITLSSIKQFKYFNLNFKKGSSSRLNKLSDLMYLLNLTSLSLYLGFGHISDLNPLSNLQYLVNLSSLNIDLMSNKISNINPLSFLQKLVKLNSLSLNLRGNSIKDLEPLLYLQKLVDLTSLSLTFRSNEIDDLNPLSYLKTLVKLKSLNIDLGSNRIIDIKSLENFRYLINLTSLTIDLVNNEFDNLYSLKNLQQLVNLKYFLLIITCKKQECKYTSISEIFDQI